MLADAPGNPRPSVVVGDALIDELRGAPGIREFIGGAALNVAVGLAVLGEASTLIAMVGDDGPGERIRSHLAAHGVTLIASPSEHGTPRAVSDRTAGEPRYAFNRAAQGRRIRFDKAARAALADAPLVIVSSFPFDDQEQYDELVAAIDEPRSRVIVDGNPRAGMLSDRARFLANLTDFASRSLLAKVGDEDADLLAGERLDVFADRLRSAGAPVVLATAGRNGACVLSAAFGTVQVDIAELRGAIVDTMGAGDATLAAIVHAIRAHGLPTDAAGWRAPLAEAMRIAAATCRAEGGLLRLSSGRR